MSHSEDEDDFLSADEDVECETQDNRCDTKANQLDGTTIARSNESINTKVIHDTSVAKGIDSIPAIKLEFDEEVVSTNPSTRHRINALKSEEKEPLEQEGMETTSDDEFSARQDDEEGEEDDDDNDEEAALTERIRERNLKIARNFSVEIVKNLQASSPIPVEVSASSPRRERYPDNTTDLNGPTNPPAPPPTPALSSSFSNQEEQFSSKNTSAGSPSLSTQYSWRLPPKPAASTNSSEPAAKEGSDCLKSTIEHKVKDSTAGESNAKSSEQARLALDRLSQKLSQSDKNLFERVAADIRNMSITGDDSITAADVTSQLTALPSTITDIGSTLSGWGWSGATRLLSSATQVTSQVGSVLNSIVDVSQPPQSTSMPAPDARDRQENPLGAGRGAKNHKND